FSRAVDMLHRALAASPDSPVINMTLGSALVESGATASGLKYLRRACELAPDSAEANYNLGMALEFSSDLESDGDLKQAHDAFERAVSIEPEHIKARIKLATITLSFGETATAAKLLR